MAILENFGLIVAVSDDNRCFHFPLFKNGGIDIENFVEIETFGDGLDVEIKERLGIDV